MERRLLTAGHPDDRFPVPPQGHFGSDYLDAPELKDIGEAICRQVLTDLDDGELIIDFRWKAKGGKSGGNLIMGKCVKLSGLVRHYALGAHFTVWLAADHCAAQRYTRWQIEALLHHELMHIEREEVEDSDGNVTGEVVYRTRGHEVELFYADIERYGLWQAPLAHLSDVVAQQAALPGFGGPMEEARALVRDAFGSESGINSISFGARDSTTGEGESVTITREDAIKAGLAR